MFPVESFPFPALLSLLYQGTKGQGDLRVTLCPADEVASGNDALLHFNISLPSRLTPPLAG